MKTFFIWSAKGYGLGDIKSAPGTFGTIGVLPLCLVLSFLPSLLALIFTFLFVLFAIVCAEFYESEMKTHDSKKIVIDEMAGYLVAMVWLPITWPSYILGFTVFRLLDIFKPFPISFIEKRLKGGVGVVMDDVLAGLFTNVFLQILYTQTPLLGQKWPL